MSPAFSPRQLASVPAVVDALETQGYIATEAIATALFLAHHLRKPVLVEGPAGVGKTDLAVSLARSLDVPLVRLQCYEGLDESKALYEWRYGKQLLYSQILKDRIDEVIDRNDSLAASMTRLAAFKDLFFSREFLEPRPVLRAMEQAGGSVLLIDEIDKADEEFEALLLEVLSDFSVTVPEIGTIEARTPPLVILTSNKTRELGDAMKRRCLHLHIDFPDPERERRIVSARVEGVTARLLTQLVAFVQAVRQEQIRKPPSISETVDWARTLLLLHADSLDPALVSATLGVLLKRQGDVAAVATRLDALLAAAIETAAAGRP